MSEKNTEFDLGIPPGETPKPVAPKKKVADPSKQRHIIYVAETEDGPGFITVGVDGVVDQIQCGVQVSVSYGVLCVLREAIATRYHKEQGPDGKETLVGRDHPSIPFQYLGPDLSGE
jgi:hypothetical protein